MMDWKPVEAAAVAAMQECVPEAAIDHFVVGQFSGRLLQVMACWPKNAHPLNQSACRILCEFEYDQSRDDVTIKMKAYGNGGDTVHTMTPLRVNRDEAARMGDANVRNIVAWAMKINILPKQAYDIDKICRMSSHVPKVIEMGPFELESTEFVCDETLVIPPPSHWSQVVYMGTPKSEDNCLQKLWEESIAPPKPGFGLVCIGAYELVDGDGNRVGMSTDLSPYMQEILDGVKGAKNQLIDEATIVKVQKGWPTPGNVDFNVKLDKPIEPADPAAISIPFSKLPENLYSGPPKHRATFVNTEGEPDPIRVPKPTPREAQLDHWYTVDKTTHVSIGATDVSHRGLGDARLSFAGAELKAGDLMQVISVNADGVILRKA